MANILSEADRICGTVVAVSEAEQQQQQQHWYDIVTEDESEAKLEQPGPNEICRAIDLDLETRIAQKKICLARLQQQLIELEKLTVEEKQNVHSTAATAAKTNSSADANGRVDMSKIRCFNCFEYGHYNRACLKPRRPKDSCFVCHQMGHTRHSCPQKRTPKTQVWLWSKGETAATAAVAEENRTVHTSETEVKHAVAHDTSVEATTTTVETPEADSMERSSEANECDDEASLAIYAAAHKAANSDSRREEILSALYKKFMSG